MNYAPITKGSVHQLSLEARDLLAEVNINVRRAKGLSVKLTQVAPVGVSFEFVSTKTRPMPACEFHVPIRMVPKIFCS